MIVSLFRALLKIISVANCAIPLHLLMDFLAVKRFGDRALADQKKL